MTNAAAIAEIGLTLHEGALTKVSRFYNGTEQDIMTELLQNARRAGATRVEVETSEETGIVAVRDDGAGISDYRTLLGFGQSEWADDSVQDEDPAGMGLFSLARRHWDVTSRCAGGDPWTVAIGPEHFDQGARATVYQADPATPVGTTIRFSMNRVHGAASAARAAARYYPLPVLVDGTEVGRSSFLADAVRRESWRGLTFGAYRGARVGAGRDSMNFHGLTIAKAPLPAISTVGERWSLRVDVEQAPELALVLPARKEVVASPFLDEIGRQGRLVLLRAIAEADPPARPSAKIWREARAAGITMPVAAALLEPFTPRAAEWWEWEPKWTGELVPARPNSLVVEIGDTLGRAVQQTFMRAAERGGIAQRLLSPIEAFKGYEWYDRLPKVTDVAVAVTLNGEEYRFRDPAEAGDEWHQGQAEQITVEYTVEAAGTRRVLKLESDVALAGDEDSWFRGDCHMLVTADAKLTPTELTSLLVRAFFAPSDDIAADSSVTQRERFEEEASRWALETLVSQDAALAEAVVTALDSVAWQLRGRGAVVRIDGSGAVKVRLGRQPDAEA